MTGVLMVVVAEGILDAAQFTQTAGCGDAGVCGVRAPAPTVPTLLRMRQARHRGPIFRRLSHGSHVL